MKKVKIMEEIGKYATLQNRNKKDYFVKVLNFINFFGKNKGFDEILKTINLRHELKKGGQTGNKGDECVYL